MSAMRWADTTDDEEDFAEPTMTPSEINDETTAPVVTPQQVRSKRG